MAIKTDFFLSFSFRVLDSETLATVLQNALLISPEQ